MDTKTKTKTTKLQLADTKRVERYLEEIEARSPADRGGHILFALGFTTKEATADPAAVRMALAEYERFQGRKADRLADWQRLRPLLGDSDWQTRAINLVQGSAKREPQHIAFLGAEVMMDGREPFMADFASGPRVFLAVRASVLLGEIVIEAEERGGSRFSKKRIEVRQQESRRTGCEIPGEIAAKMAAVAALKVAQDLKEKVDADCEAKAQAVADAISACAGAVTYER